MTLGSSDSRKNYRCMIHSKHQAGETEINLRCTYECMKDLGVQI
jgi:hypothetical protein